MTFTDSDLERLKSGSCDPRLINTVEMVTALLARLEAAEKICVCYQEHFRDTGKLTWPEIQLHQAWLASKGE